MTVLVAVASWRPGSSGLWLSRMHRYGAARMRGTAREIADEIGVTLHLALHRLGEDSRVDVCSADKVADVTSYDAIILGSSVHKGEWLAPARLLIERHDLELRKRPVWLFSSGPGPEQGADQPSVPGDVARLACLAGACEHRVFPGEPDHGWQLGPGVPGGRTRAALGRQGGYRDWESIRVWARGIASGLHAVGVLQPAPAPAPKAAPKPALEPTELADWGFTHDVRYGP